MSTIIKATDHNRGLHGVAFNFDDISQNADAYLSKIREHAGQILAKATQEAQAIRKAAENEGRKIAEQGVDALAGQKVDQQMQTLLPALRSAIDQVQQAKPTWLAQWDRRAIHLATAIAARVIRRELSHSPEIPLNLVREALQLASSGGRVQVLMNPQDFANLKDSLATLQAEFSRLAPAEIVADSRITPGGCRVETQHGSIDQQFDVQLARIEAELV
jgi:flagellar assembly protein FliH